MKDENIKAATYSQNASDVLLKYTRGTLQNTSQTDLPVLLYIHGGNNQTGKSLLWIPLP